MRSTLKRTVVLFALVALLSVIPLGCSSTGANTAATPAAAKTTAATSAATTATTSTAATTSAEASAPAGNPLTGPAADYYKGKTVTIYTGTGGAGSPNDLWARTLAKYLPDITGAKYVVVNETAGGGRVIANQLYGTMKPDGLAMEFVPAGELWTPYMTGDAAVKYEMSKYAYIGGVSSGNFIMLVGPDSKYKTVEDLIKTKGLKFAHSNRTASTTYANALAMDILGMDRKIVTGFEGGAAARLLAIQQGEADATVLNPDNALASQQKGQATTIMQVGVNRTKPGENLPTMMEFVKAENLNETQKRLIGSLDFLWDAKMLIMTPGTSQDKVDFMSAAFKTLLEKPEFRAEISKATSTEIGPYVSGADIAKRGAALAEKKGDVALWNDLLNKYAPK
jgi:tripartite-type tricarboxylate transporter receptor subunit TctC